MNAWAAGSAQIKLMRLAKLSNLSLPMIKCCCGAEILLVPNVKLMSEAIEAHVEEHMKKAKSQKEAEAEAKRIGDFLLVQVLSKACDV
jgi:hypothetical protein